MEATQHDFILTGLHEQGRRVELVLTSGETTARYQVQWYYSQSLMKAPRQLEVEHRGKIYLITLPKAFHPPDKGFGKDIDIDIRDNWLEKHVVPLLTEYLNHHVFNHGKLKKVSNHGG